MANFQLFFSVQGTSGSPTGSDPESRVIKTLEVSWAKDLSALPRITAIDICFAYALCRLLSVYFPNLGRILLFYYILQQPFL